MLSNYFILLITVTLRLWCQTDPGFMTFILTCLQIASNCSTIMKEAKTDEVCQECGHLGYDAVSLWVDFSASEKEDCKILGVMLCRWAGICQHFKGL